MRRVFRLLLGFLLFIPLASFAIFFLFGAIVELTQPWGMRSAPPQDEPPPSLLLKLPIALPFLLGAFGLFIVAAYVAKRSLDKNGKQREPSDSEHAKL